MLMLFFLFFFGFVMLFMFNFPPTCETVLLCSIRSKINLFFIRDFGMFKVFIKILYISKSSSLCMGALTVRKILLTSRKFLLILGGKIMLPFSSIIFLKYSKSSFTLFNFFSFGKCNIKHLS